MTPPEVASLADRASRGRDPNVVKASAELALSCLPRAHALNPNEIQRALIQCKEQSREMLERAGLAVESAAKGGGVYPEVFERSVRILYHILNMLDKIPNLNKVQVFTMLNSLKITFMLNGLNLVNIFVSDSLDRVPLKMFILTSIILFKQYQVNRDTDFVHRNSI